MFPAIGPHRVTGPPLKMSATPGRVGAAAPEPGEHTRSVLSDLLGLDAGTIDELGRSGIIGGR
jgi:crotonobetainyl-CoA:carnitine CoA-transferase CaiB-like acyl-CoA transferase